MSGRTGRVAGILSTAAVAALVVTALDAESRRPGFGAGRGTADDGGPRQPGLVDPAGSSRPEARRDVAVPACRKADTDMVWIRFGTPDTLSGPQDAGWTYAQNLGPHRPLAPC